MGRLQNMTNYGAAFWGCFMLFALQTSAQVFEVTPENTQYINQHLERGKLVSELRDDLLGGTWVLYFDTEKLRKIEQCTYRNEKRHGEHVCWYLNSQMKSRTYYENGKKVGKETHWYENGQIMSETSAHSISDTVCDRKEWYKSGELRYTEKRNGNKRLGTVYYPDGTIKCERVEIYVNDGSLLLPRYVLLSEVCRCKNGNTLYDYSTKAGEQTSFKEYHCNGQLKAEGQMIQAKDYKTGTWRYFRIDGTPEREEHYQDAKSVTETNVKTGTWIYYNEAGSIIRQEIYEKGKLLESRFED